MGWKLKKIGNTFINSSKNCTEPKIPYNLPWSGGQILPGYYNSFWSLRNFFSLRFYTKASYSLENIKNSLSVLQENRNKNYDFERQKNVKWSSSNHLALSPLELNESGFMSRYWHFLITHSLKRQGSHEQDESKINARWMLKVISDAPNRTESRSPRFCAQGIRSYGVSGTLLRISWWFHEKGLYLCHHKPQLVFHYTFQKTYETPKFRIFWATKNKA